MKMMSVILMTLCLGLFGCSGDSGSGSSEPPSFDSSGTWNTRTNQPAPVLMVTLVLDQESSSSPHISGEWGSQGDPCFASGTTNGFSGTISASQITLYLTDESAGQVRQIRASLNGIGGPPPASLSGIYTVTRHDTNPACVGTEQSVLLDCDFGTACGSNPP